MQTGQDDQADQLVASLRKAAQQLLGQRSMRDMDATLSSIVEAAVETIPEVDAGGVSITEAGKVWSRNPTTTVVTKLDGLQNELFEGPCISALEEPPEDGVIVAQDLGGEDGKRWPRFSPQAVEAGYRAILSTAIAAHGDMRAALNLYAAAPNGFDTETRRLAGLFGVQAAMLLYGSEQAGHLQKAVDSRDVIGQAKGILMERFNLTHAEAFQMLVKSSQDTNLKLVGVAEWLTRENEKHASQRSKGADPA